MIHSLNEISGGSWTFSNCFYLLFKLMIQWPILFLCLHFKAHNSFLNTITYHTQSGVHTVTIFFTFTIVILLSFVAFFEREFKGTFIDQILSSLFFLDNESKPLSAHRKVRLCSVGTELQCGSLQGHHICSISLFHDTSVLLLNS